MGIVKKRVRCVVGAGAAMTLGGCGSTPPAHKPTGVASYIQSRDTITAYSDVWMMLSTWHIAAAHGDFDNYFSRMTDDAVFLGTDPGERWTRPEFEAFARPYFDGKEAWTYTMIDRNVILEPGDDPGIAWFDESLENRKYGRCRGTGVAVRKDDGAWRIAHYSLTFLIPNEKTPEVMEAVYGPGFGSE